jgi:exopolysaccharide biosynthesis polyprenyl glycosylphosphotransferase
VLRAHAKFFQNLQLVADVLVSALVFGAVISLPELRSGDRWMEAGVFALLVPGLVASLIWPLALDYLGLYESKRRQDPGEVLRRFALAGVIATVGIAAAVVVSGTPVRPIFSVVVGTGQFATLASIHIMVLIALRAARRRGHNFRNVLIVGSGARARHVLQAVQRHSEWGLRVVGFMDEDDTPHDARIPADKIFKLPELPNVLRDNVIDEVIVACPRSLLGSIGPVVAVCAAAGVPLTLLSDLFGDYLPPPQVTSFGTLAALSFAPVHHNSAMLVIKRGIDVVGAALLLTVSAPVLALAAIAIKATSPGPILFRQVRCGRNGRHFEMVKLRTMQNDAEARKAELMELNEMDGPVFKIRQDPRVTRVGSVLRRFSIDEIPQFWNVLRGEMSLVGPRPPVPVEVAEYGTFDRRRLSMRPGITCLWQVSGRNAIGFDSWVKLDLEYIDSWSLVNDFKIMLRTIPAALKGTGS